MRFRMQEEAVNHHKEEHGTPDMPDEPDLCHLQTTPCVNEATYSMATEPPLPSSDHRLVINRSETDVPPPPILTSESTRHIKRYRSHTEEPRRHQTDNNGELGIPGHLRAT
jgi:hypothetical protein